MAIIHRLTELASSEFLMQQLKALMDAGGKEMLESLPDGIHSGLAKLGAKGVFFYFQAPASEGGPLGPRHRDSRPGSTGRRVDDVWAAMGILNGAHLRDPRSVDVALDRPEPDRRVAGVVTAGGSLQPAVADAVDRAASALADAGWELEEVELPELALVDEIWMRIMCDDIPGLVDAVGPLVTPRLVEVLLDHVTYYDQDRIPRMALYPERQRLMRRWTALFQQIPVVVGPVWPEQAFAAGADMEYGIEFIAPFFQFLTAAPLLGIPALAVPTGLSDGVPVGVQVQADRWNDAWCFEAGRAIEDRVGVVELRT
jgi:amidase